MFFENETNRLLSRFLFDPFFGMEGSCEKGACCADHEESADGPQNPGVRYYGLVMTTGPDGRPVIHKYGNARPAGRRPTLADAADSAEARALPVDTIVDEKGKVVKMIAEMPGVEKRDIKIAVEERHVSVSAEGGGGKRYQMRIPLDRRVDTSFTKASYRNGILQITFGLAEDTNRGKTVKVD